MSKAQREKLASIPADQQKTLWDSASSWTCETSRL